MVSFFQIGSKQLRRLCAVTGFGVHEQEEAVELFRHMLVGWGDRPVPNKPHFPSDIGDDHTPYEFSLAFGRGATELRVLLEAQAETASLMATQKAGLVLQERLVRDFGIDTERFNSVRDLFIVDNPQGRFTLWHAVCLWPGRSPEFKLYLNPQNRGREPALGIIQEALERLGFREAIPTLLEIGGRRGLALDEPAYFSLDVSPRAGGTRVKVYFRHHRVNASELETSFAAVPGHVHGDVMGFFGSLGCGTGPFNGKPVTSCLSFISGNTWPNTVTLQFPIAHYAEHDGAVHERVMALMKAHGLPWKTYDEGIRTFVPSPLNSGPLLQSYVSYRREREGVRIVVYLSPALFAQAQQQAVA